MKPKIFTIIILLVLTSCSFSQKKNTEANLTTYYFIRHAEKDRSDAKNRNPVLTEIGEQRAENWQSYFKDVKFDAVYATDYNRTKQTAMPTAKANQLDIKIYDANTLYSEEFQKNTKDKTVLVVGHSNTTPAFVNAILGEERYESIDDNTNSNLYIVKISDGKISDELLNVE